MIKHTLQIGPARLEPLALPAQSKTVDNTAGFDIDITDPDLIQFGDSDDAITFICDSTVHGLIM